MRSHDNFESIGPRLRNRLDHDAHLTEVRMTAQERDVVLEVWVGMDHMDRIGLVVWMLIKISIIFWVLYNALPVFHRAAANVEDSGSRTITRP